MYVYLCSYLRLVNVGKFIYRCDGELYLIAVKHNCPRFLPLFKFKYFIDHCFICHLSDSTVSEIAGIEPRTAATFDNLASRLVTGLWIRIRMDPH
jgi:hypothetical protein